MGQWSSPGPSALLAKDTILSGPLAEWWARWRLRAGWLADGALVGFDMGGTSTDVFCVPAGEGLETLERSPQTEIAGLTLLAPRLPIHTVAAGGGSILSVEEQRLQVGPRSAGADPGPACYRRGGPLCLTDAHVLLGRLQVAHFPAVFGPQGDQPPDLEVVQQRFAELAAPLDCSVEQLAHGALDLAVETMAAAIQQVSLFCGHDIRGGVLIAYGGAGGQLACRLAESLGLKRVLLHPLAGVLSAWGIGQARERRWHQRAVRQTLSPLLLQQLQEWLAQQEAGDCPQRCLELRDQAHEQGLLLPWPDGAGPAELELAFAEAHQQRFGYRPAAGTRLVVERIEGEWPLPQLSEGATTTWTAPSLEADHPATALVHIPQVGWQPVPVVPRANLQPGQSLVGPVLIPEATGCTVLEPGWTAAVDGLGNLLLEHQTSVALPKPQALASASADPVELGLFHHRFMAIAERMGAAAPHQPFGEHPRAA